MEIAQPQLDRIQSRRREQFERMQLTVRPLPDGSSVLVSLPLDNAPLESLSGPLKIRRVVFSTVGTHQIKCLRPRALFGLGLLDVRHCADAASIEAAIRKAWRTHTQALRDAQARLRDLGLDVEAVAGSSALAFPLAGELPNVRVTMQRLGEAILPSIGPLSGLALEGIADRVLEVSDVLGSAADLECRIGQRIEEVRQDHRRLEEAARGRSQIEAPPKKQPDAASPRPKILVVGPQLVEATSLLEELERQGFQITTSRGESEALARFSSMSPDLVVSEYILGRSDGASLVQAMSGLPGIERIPVVLLDDARRESRRDIARAVGAAGYLPEPVDARPFVTRLTRLIDELGNRRFTRYHQRLAARLEGAVQGCLITELGRGGVFLATPQIIESQTSMRCEMALPEIGHALRFEGEVRYCNEAQGAMRQGIGLRFFDMSSRDEAALIQYLGLLESQR